MIETLLVERERELCSKANFERSASPETLMRQRSPLRLTS